MPNRLSENLIAASQRHPDLIAVRADAVTYTFADLHRAAARMAALLQQRGVAPGDRVGVMLPNTPAFAVVFYGIVFAGAVAVPMNPLLKSREVEFYLANTGAKAVFATFATAEDTRAGAAAAGTPAWIVDGDDAGLSALLGNVTALLDPVPREDGDDAVILHTSGTTGEPKGARLTQLGLARNAEITARTLIDIGPGDVVMGCLPLFHVFGLTCGLNAAVLAGATLTLLTRFDPVAALEVIERDGVTVFQGVPTMYSAVLGVAAQATPQATRTLRTCISGGAPLPAQVLADFEQAFGCIILEGYGLSETSPVASFNHPRAPRKVGSIGTPVDGVEMRIGDGNGHEMPTGTAGEIEIRGHNVMTGYWNNPEGTRAAISADGWFATGDVARVDEDGYYFILDRKKDLIIRGGYNVYPREIEDVLYEHPSVAEAAVIGVAHDSLGEEVGAAVALKDGATADAEELRDFVKSRIAAYKYPRYVWFVDALPKSATGKILRREVTCPTAVKAR